ncbi:MAG: type III pantothenate kinase [Planctomycetes bacterium]|nr:type III pantothenate kinase [Planctomycetota bacterium]
MQSDQSSDFCLLCDLGNSSIKVALGTGPRPVSEGLDPLLSWAHKGSTQPSTWWPLWRELEARKIQPSRILLSSVAGSRVCDSLLVGFQREGMSSVQVNPDAGLELRIRHPETAGMDRLYAARAAFEWAGQKSVIVVDAGTALTVDVVVPDAAGSGGAFLGGAIAPGPEMLASALGEGGAKLSKVQPEPHVKALGQETSEALASGVVVGFEGAALHLVERLVLEAQLEDPTVVLTGGASDYLERVLSKRGWNLVHEPSLVPFGLWLAAGDSRA